MDRIRVYNTDLPQTAKDVNCEIIPRENSSQHLLCFDADAILSKWLGFDAITLRRMADALESADAGTTS